MIDPYPTIAPELPDSPKQRGFAGQFCWTIFFALILAVGLFAFRHGRLPGPDLSLFAGADSPTSASGTSPGPAPSAGNYPGAPYAPPAAPVNPSSPANPTFNPLSALIDTFSWKQQVCSDLIFEAPMTLVPSAAPGPIPPSIKAQMEFSSIWQGQINDRLAVFVWVFRINGQHTLSLEDSRRAGEAYLRSSGATIEDQAFHPAPIWVSGCTARRVSGSRASTHGLHHLDSLTIQRRREAMIITVEYVEGMANDAMRILNSVQVRGGANG